MLIIRTLTPGLLLLASLMSRAAEDVPGPKEKNTSSAGAAKTNLVKYTFHIDNAVNKNNTVDSVWVILDKYDRSGAGIVKKVFYPNASNEVVIEDLPAGKYYADIYVLGLYKKHFSSVISSGKSRKNIVRLHLDYQDVYQPGNANIPDENTKLFAYTR